MVVAPSARTASTASRGFGPYPTTSPQQYTASYPASFARWMHASSASMLEWMSLKMKKRIVYDVFNATSQSSWLHRRVGFADVDCRWSICSEYEYPRGIAGVGDDITLRGGACLRSVWPHRGAG